VPYKKSLLMPPACPVVPSRSLLQGALQKILIDATGLSGGALTLVATPEAFQEILIDATGLSGGSSRSSLQGALQEILIDATGLSGGSLTLVATRRFTRNPY